MRRSGCGRMPSTSMEGYVSLAIPPFHIRCIDMIFSLQIYHATCRAEALSSTTALTAKLRLGFANNSPSRSVTPEVSSAPLSRMTPPRSSMASVPARLKSDSPKGSGGMKRKISSVDGAVGTSGNAGVGGDGPPPSKKIVISVSV